MYRKKKGKELQLQIADCNTFPLNSTAKFSSVQEQVLTELFKSLRYSLIKITRFVTEMHKRKEQTLNLPIFNVYSFASDPMQNCSFGHSPKQQLQHWDFCPWGEAHSKVRCRRKVGGVHSSARNPRCRHTGVWRHRYLLGTRSCLGLCSGWAFRSQPESAEGAAASRLLSPPRSSLARRFPAEPSTNWGAKGEAGAASALLQGVESSSWCTCCFHPASAIRAPSSKTSPTQLNKLEKGLKS